MKTKKSLITYVLLILGVLILLNIASDYVFTRLDFTSDKRYTLSKATKDIIKSLPEPVTIKAYFSDNLPQSVAKVKSDFRDLLEEYAARSNGMIAFEFINPNKNAKTEKEAMQNGIEPLLINVREKDQVKQQKAFLGVKIELGDMQDVIPVVKPGVAMEYALSKSLKKVSISQKPKIGFLQGHGEPSLSEMRQIVQELNVMYNVMPVNLNDTANELLKYKAIAIVRPLDSFPKSHLQQLSEYMKQGGKLLVALNRVDGNLQKSQGYSISTGLESWLAKKGITVENSFAIDAKCGSIQVRQGFFSINMEFPYLPIITHFAKHPITTGLEATIFKFASPVSFTGDSAYKYTALAKTSKKSGTQPAETYFNVQKKWTASDFTASSLTVAGALEGKFGGTKEGKMVVVGDGDFVINGSGQNAQKLQGDNINLFANSIDWLSDDTGLIALRTKGITSRPIEELKDNSKSILKYLNFFLPIILIIGYGVIRAQKRKNLRYKRMQTGYVK